MTAPPWPSYPEPLDPLERHTPSLLPLRLVYEISQLDPATSLYARRTGLGLIAIARTPAARYHRPASHGQPARTATYHPADPHIVATHRLPLLSHIANNLPEHLQLLDDDHTGLLLTSPADRDILCPAHGGQARSRCVSFDCHLYLPAARYRERS